MKVSEKISAKGSFDQVFTRLTEVLKEQGFGILTRIDFHQKIEEKLGKKIPPTVILGACHPGLAFEAVQLNPQVVNLMPCNVVMTEVAKDKWAVEFALAEPILSVLKDKKLQAFAKNVDKKIKQAAKTLGQ
jgi:uncharacterized protein (DUF302 family)